MSHEILDYVVFLSFSPLEDRRINRSTASGHVMASGSHIKSRAIHRRGLWTCPLFVVLPDPCVRQADIRSGNPTPGRLRRSPLHLLPRSDGLESTGSMRWERGSWTAWGREALVGALLGSSYASSSD